MKYYVNEVHLDTPIHGCKTDYGHSYIGLFTNNAWEGKGSFCGWYGAEFYINTRLIAFYQFGDGTMYYKPKIMLSDVYQCNKYFDSIMIGSCYWERVIEADNDEDAIRKFSNLEFPD